MFKNMKISTGTNVLMCVFIIFMAIITFFTIASGDRFDKEIDFVLTVTQKHDALNRASSDLVSASGLVMMNRLNSNAVNRSVEQSTLENITHLLTSANASYKIFKDLPDLSREEQAQNENVYRAYNNLLAFVSKTKNELTDPNANFANAIELEQKAYQLSDELKTHRERYSQIMNNILEKHMDEADKINLRMIYTAGFIMLVSIIMVLLARMWLKRALFARLEQAKATFAMIAAGDLSKEVETGANDEIGEMMAALGKMRLSLTAMIADIRRGVTSIFGSAQEIASSNNNLSSRTEQQASALQQTAASMEELKITVRQNADNAHSAKQLVEGASSSARKGGDVMGNLDGIMREITENSRQIADINGVIDSIANQTNILALNAAVEAARAGEQGRGFAVVAGEVRSLAKRSADAAKEIRQLINVCVANMNTGSQEVELANMAMEEVVKSVTQVTDIMAEITSASDEQSTGISQIAQAVNEMDLVTQQNASMVEQAAGVARSVEEHARDLESVVSMFSLQRDLPMNTIEGADVKRVKTAASSEPVISKKKAEDDWVSF
ncbi:HAMP domain-containing protein [Candidatus Pantoea deserta]|uniref:HAMP domain-containing protein n=2 Tax=Candidatus Pantoea deserta TaxID=1869313 RepID=A0A3N4PYQ7_9GAMM|nr:HAMP domain-containing protein [Pantoea deserta]